MVDEAFGQAEDGALDDQCRDQLRIWDVALVRLRRLLVVECRPEQVEALLGDEAGQQPGHDPYRSEDQLHSLAGYPCDRCRNLAHEPGRDRRGLRRADCSAAGISRARRGRGFSYVDAEGGRIEDDETLERIRELAIPPAWEDVWICPDPFGHIQATGIDAAGRKQYLYHERWQQRAAARKFEAMREFAAALPRLRRAVTADLRREGMPRERALACAVRLLDLGFFRIGGEEYAETNESYGVATISASTSRSSGDEIVFDFPAKSGQRRVQSIRDAAARRRSRRCAAAAAARRICSSSARAAAGATSAPTTSTSTSRRRSASEFSAKDFRTWHGTVLAAAELAGERAAAAPRAAAKRAIRAAVNAVAERARQHARGLPRSYIDPRCSTAFATARRSSCRRPTARSWS